MIKRTLSTLFIALVVAASGRAADKPSFTVGWSVYVGWNPWAYMQKSGILKKWADKYNVSIRVQRFDYAPSLDAFVGKNIDACAMTNMEALDMPAAAGIDTTSIITGDYSNGNDALLVRNNLTLQGLPGKKVLLVQKTVSEYLYERAMTLGGLESQIKKVKLINTSDSDIATAFIADKSQDAVVTWKPMVSQIAKIPGATLIPLGDLPKRVNELDSSVEIVAQCRSGVRSGKACDFLRQAGFTKVKNLTGGILAWSDQVDPSVPKY